MTCLLCDRPAEITHHVAGRRNDPDLTCRLCRPHAGWADRMLAVLGVPLEDGPREAAEIAYARIAGVIALAAEALGADHPGLVRAIREASRGASRALGRYIGPRPTEEALPSPLPPTGKTDGLRSLFGTGGDPVRAVSRWCRRQAEAFA